MRLLAPAKLNLHLRVGRRDASGFHPLVSWFCTVGLFDTLTIGPSDSPGVMFACDDPAIPADGRNLVVRAAQAALARARQPAGVEIALVKRVPSGAGMGGGSSDAAQTLLGMNRLLGLQIAPADLQAMAAHLGSDVPFFLRGGSCLCSGRGEIVRPVKPPRARWALLVFPGFALSTVDVYRQFDALDAIDPDFDAPAALEEWAELSARPLLARLRNDLEPAAFSLAPGLGRLRDALEADLSRVIRMTGSGSTLFTLFDEQADAESSEQSVAARHSLATAVVELAPNVDDDASVLHIEE